MSVEVAAPIGSDREESVDIQNSLDRIEQLLNRGQQLLYGDEEADTDRVLAPSAQHVDVVNEPSNRPKNSGSAHQQHSSGSRLSANRTASGNRKQRLTGRRKDADLSASLRGRQLALLAKEGGKVPNFEEGIDEADMPQNISIAELKARIHRELEEYRRSGPLMHRRGSNPLQHRVASGSYPPTTSQRSVKPATTPARQLDASAASPPTRTLMMKHAITAPSAYATALNGTSAHDTAVARRANPKPTSVFKRTSAAISPSKPPVKRTKTAASHKVEQNSKGQTPFWVRLYRHTGLENERPGPGAERQPSHIVGSQRENSTMRESSRPTAASSLPKKRTADSRTLQMGMADEHPSQEASSKWLLRGGGAAPSQHTVYAPRKVAAAPSPPWMGKRRNGAAHGARTPEANPHKGVGSAGDKQVSGPYIAPLDLTGIRK